MTMLRRLCPLLLAMLMPAAPVRAAQVQTVRLPLDPASLGGAGIFTTAEQRAAAAAAAAGTTFVSEPRPLPPQVIVTLDTADGKIGKTGGRLFWRGDMLPDQLAPGETGTLIRKRRDSGAAWKKVRAQRDFALAAHPDLVPVARPPLPALIIETPYQLGMIATSAVELVLWRTAEEGSPPLAGFIALQNPHPAAVNFLIRSLPAFTNGDFWAAEFNALAP